MGLEEMIRRGVACVLMSVLIRRHDLRDLISSNKTQDWPGLDSDTTHQQSDNMWGNLSLSLSLLELLNLDLIFLHHENIRLMISLRIAM